MAKGCWKAVEARTNSGEMPTFSVFCSTGGGKRIQRKPFSVSNEGGTTKEHNNKSLIVGKKKSRLPVHYVRAVD